MTEFLKRPSFGKVLVRTVLPIVLLCFAAAAVLFPVFAQAKLGGLRGCPARVHGLVGATLQYAEDYDERLPPAEIWMDALDSRAERLNLTKSHGPTIRMHFDDPLGIQDPDRFAFGYAFRESLSHALTKSVSEPRTEALIFDSRVRKRNAHGGLNLLPTPGVHRDGNTIGYLDGHVANDRFSTTY